MSERPVSDLALPGSGDMAIEAHLVDPGVPPTLGALFLHWFEPQADDGNRGQFLDEARELADAGVVSILPQLLFPWSGDPSGAVADIARIEAELARLRACVDELARRGAGRVVLVGHDFGAMHGVLLMARDARLVGGVLIAPANRWADWFLRFWPISEDRIEYQRALRPLDPIEHIGALAPRQLLLQFANRDYFIAGMDAAELFRAAGEPKRIELYDADHALRSDAARADRRDFILERRAYGRI
jgi:dienelactone hydrolase